MTFLTLVTDNSGPESQSMNAIRRALRASNRAANVSGVISLEKLVGETILVRSVTFLLMLSFAGLALLLSAIGIYGVMSYFVTQRKCEIGLRIALGATPNDVLRLILGEGLRTAFAGSVIGLLAAVLSGRVLSGLLYGVRPVDISVYGAIAGVVLVTALLASYVPAHRATQTNAIVAIRQA